MIEKRFEYRYSIFIVNVIKYNMKRGKHEKNKYGFNKATG